jgi:hypothetical protein
MIKLILNGIEARLAIIEEQGNASLDETTELKRQIASMQLQLAHLTELLETISKTVNQMKSPWPQLPNPTPTQPWPDKPAILPGILSPNWTPPPEIWGDTNGIKVT